MALNELIHQPVRLRVMVSLSALGADEQMDFTTLRDLLGLTDGNLGAHLARLEAAGYVRVDKTFVERRPRTRLQLTSRGRMVLGEHVAALRELLG